MFQTVQRLSDSWRTPIGSAGIAVVMAFCDSEESLANSDENRVEFANYLLEKFRFMYEDSEDDNKEVRALIALIVS